MCVCVKEADDLFTDPHTELEGLFKWFLLFFPFSLSGVVVVEIHDYFERTNVHVCPILTDT